LRAASKSLGCFDRFAQAISGVELIRETNHINQRGFQAREAIEMARQTIFPGWHLQEGKSISDRGKPSEPIYIQQWLNINSKSKYDARIQ
jgi:hypothetical protein